MIDYKQAHADIALLYRAAHQHCTYEDKTHYRELDIQQAQERLSTLLESVRILEELARQYTPKPRPIDTSPRPCGEIALSPYVEGT